MGPQSEGPSAVPSDSSALLVFTCALFPSDFFYFPGYEYHIYPENSENFIISQDLTHPLGYLIDL
jgi:hypothetical protein